MHGAWWRVINYKKSIAQFFARKNWDSISEDTVAITIATAKGKESKNVSSFNRSKILFFQSNETL